MKYVNPFKDYTMMAVSGLILFVLALFTDGSDLLNFTSVCHIIMQGTYCNAINKQIDPTQRYLSFRN